MKNPWLMKNPFLSMWLSGANAFWGAARGQSMAAGRSLLTVMAEENMRQVLRFWSGAFALAPPVAALKRRPGARKHRR